MRILQRSSLATLDCLMSEIAVTRVSMALANSPVLASATARAMALLDTVLFLDMISSNSDSLMAGFSGSCLEGIDDDAGNILLSLVGPR